MHVLIVGNREIDRASFVDWLISMLEPPPKLYGYRSVKEAADADGILVMDKIGPVESRSPRSCAAIRAALDGGTPILASVRDNEAPFLNCVHSHPSAKYFYPTKENEESLFSVLDFLQEQHSSKQE